MPITFVDGSATIGTTEYWLASNSTTKTDQTDAAVVQVWIDFGQMASTDTYEWRVVEKVGSGTQRNVIPPQRLVGAQPSPIVTPSLVLGAGWEIGVRLVSGTARTIYWSIRKIT